MLQEKVSLAFPQVIFHPDMKTEFGDSNTMGLLTTTGELFFFSLRGSEISEDDTAFVQSSVAGGNGFAVKCQDWKFLGRCDMDRSKRLLTNLCWMNDNIILASSTEANVAVVVALRLIRQQESLSFSVKEESSFMCEDLPFSIDRDSRGHVAAVQLVDGKVFKYECGSDVLLPWMTTDHLELDLMSVCFKVTVAKADGQYTFVGLSEAHRLYVEDLEVASDVTSFELHSDYLLATTMKHQLRCVPINDILDKRNVWKSESTRSLERGSKLILAVAKDSKTILQMPRGNLEVVHPRPLVIHSVKNHLDNCQYGMSLEILRRHRINLNLLVDHNPDKFLQNTVDFVHQLEDVARLCLFISDLQ